jgi:AbrB family looped-hinge helix DNA binding protein
MASRLTLDKAGRIVLPKPVRDELQLQPGDTLELETYGEKITLTPARASGRLRKKDGVWVFRCEEPLTEEIVERTAREIRRERDERIWGKRS